MRELVSIEMDIGWSIHGYVGFNDIAMGCAIPGAIGLPIVISGLGETMGRCDGLGLVGLDEDT